jgi:hypothetical protein
MRSRGRRCNCASGRLDSGCLETLKQKLYGHGPFTDRRGYALDGATAHVADTEDPGPAGFEEQGFRPAGVPLPQRYVWAGEEKSMIVSGELAIEPLRAGLGANEDEERPNRQARPLVR